MQNENLHKKATEFGDKFKALEDEATQFFRGKKVRIISNYNGQPYGCSKKPMTGQIMTIENVCLEGGVSFGCKEELPYIRLREAEFI